jgi:hypothetical protein
MYWVHDSIETLVSHLDLKTGFYSPCILIHENSLEIARGLRMRCNQYWPNIASSTKAARKKERAIEFERDGEKEDKQTVANVRGAPLHIGTVITLRLKTGFYSPCWLVAYI